MADSGEPTGRRSAPRHAATRSGRGTEPVRLDTRRLPALDSPAAGGPRRTAALLLLALGITGAVVAWGYLVYLAIDFGTSARNGERAAWWFLGLATLGAIACLYVAMMLVARLVNRLRAAAAPGTPPRTPGGRRAAR